MNIKTVCKKVKRKYGAEVFAGEDERSVFVRGSAANWQQAVEIGKMFVKKGKHVVNDVLPQGFVPPKPMLPKIADDKLQGTHWDVAIVGGGISGCAVARELSRYDLKILLCEKHGDVAHGASGANDGMVHAGIDLAHQCLKLKYAVKGNAMYGEICDELGVDFVREGQYVVFTSRLIKLLAKSYLVRAKKHGIPGVSIIGKREISSIEPSVAGFAVGALKIPSTGAVSPYKLTIAYAENAVQNGVTVSLDTAVLSMRREGDKICSVTTNSGTFTADCVINCAGVFADVVAEMAGDRYFSIHPRKGTDLLLDANAPNAPTHSVSLAPTLKTLGQNKNTKGGGIVKTVDGNLLLGPDAVETPLREDTSTTAQSVNGVFEKQRKASPKLSRSSVIAYFSGVRAPTYEEDFILERSEKVKNLIHVAGIQSPGLTAAPAFAPDVAALAVDYLRSCGKTVDANVGFCGKRQKPVCTKGMEEDSLQQLIERDADFGRVVCRCEQVTLGEIKQAINNPLGVATVDGVKRRVRAGMGRCQGGFCLPTVLKTIAEQKGVRLSQVCKGDEGSYVAAGEIKSGE